MVLESGFLTHSIKFIYGLFTEKNSLRFRHFSIFHNNFQQTIAQPTIRLPIKAEINLCHRFDTPFNKILDKSLFSPNY